MTKLLTFPNFFIKILNRQLRIAISVITNSTRDQVMATGAQCYQIIFRRFVGDFRITRWAVMYIQRITRTILITKATSVSVHFNTPLALIPPHVRTYIFLIVQKPLLNHKPAALSFRVFVTKAGQFPKQRAYAGNKKLPGYCDIGIIP